MRRYIILFMVSIAVTFVTASATIINVPDDYETIQEGIDASSDGDTVLVQPDTYYENINFNGHNIVLGSWFITTGHSYYISYTIIDGNSSGSVVTFESGENSTAVIKGFTLQNGSSGSYGGGVFCENSDPVIADNIIIGNIAWSGVGGGVYCDNSNATITHNTIRENEANFGGSGAYGGGIACIGSSNLTISNNVISDNITFGEWDFGGGIFLYSSGGTIYNNLIAGHSAHGWGGGIHCDESSPLIINNTITGNSGHGGGIYCRESSPTIRNTILWANSSDQIDTYQSSPLVQYCDVEGGWAGQGNIDCDPMFCDPESGDYYLDAHSCCVGAGQGGVDIGAFGVGCHSPDIINIPADYETIQEGIDNSYDGDTVLVQPGSYVENINFNGHNIVLGSMFLITGDNSYISTTIIDGNGSGSVVTVNSGENNSAAIKGFTLRNGSNIRGAGVYCQGSDLTIASNIIEDNYAYADENWNGLGGGIYCEQSSPTISSNVIRNNTAYYYGGGIYCSASDATINFNLIVGDSALYGGGICCDHSNPAIINNTVYHNIAEMGGGIYTMFTSYPIITNTVFWADTAMFDGNEIAGDDASSPLITYCDIQDIEWPGEGNISVDPLFRDPDNNDFHLMSTECSDPDDSPCIDAGHPDIHDDLLDCFWGLGEVLSDMGAYGGGNEATDCVYIPGDCNHNGTPLELEDALIIVGIYRGDIDPYYTCECPPYGSDFAPEADPNGNCIPFEIGDVVTEIAAYRGNESVSGCEDCPGSLRLIPNMEWHGRLR